MFTSRFASSLRQAFDGSRRFLRLGLIGTLSLGALDYAARRVERVASATERMATATERIAVAIRQTEVHAGAEFTFDGQANAHKKD